MANYLVPNRQLQRSRQSGKTGLPEKLKTPAE
jgi:hypothetical protein